MSDARQQQSRTGGEVADRISAGIVGLLKEFYGTGPSEAKTYMVDDLVVCLLHGGFTRIERTLKDQGREHMVINQRHEFQVIMRERFRELVAGATGREVVGFMSGNQVDPEMTVEVFVLGSEL